MTATYQGHLPDGSSVQKHSAGSFYPYVLVLRDARTPGAKFDYGVIGPGVEGDLWLSSFENWVVVVQALQAQRAKRD